MPKREIKYETHQAKTNEKTRSVSLIVTKNCNLRCSYCYEKHDLRDNEQMPLEVAKMVLKEYLDADDDFKQVAIDFFGGEPLLAFPLIEEIVKWVMEHPWKKDYRFMIGTNGTLLTDTMKQWLLKHRHIMNVALSLDGTKKAHDLTRDNSYDQVKPHIPFLTKNWPHQAAKMTISADTIPYVAESVIELEEMGIFFSANVGFEDMWGTEAEKKNSLRIYEEQLDLLVEYYASRPELFPVAPLLTVFPYYLGMKDSGESIRNGIGMKRFCGAGHEMVVVDIDGNRYPCHRFLPWIAGLPAPDGKVNCQHAWKPDKCADCELILSCPTCAGFNWEVNGDTGIRTTFHCDFFKLEVLASAKLEAIRLTQKINSLKNMELSERQTLKGKLEAVMKMIESGV